jgi:quercetin dioxygenase-like cupin family protein
MSEEVTVRGPGEGRTLLVGGSDYVTYKVRSAETEREYFCFEVSATPGFGPPPHKHAYRELFYVLDGEYEFTLMQEGATRTLVGTRGTALAIEPNVPHTFRNVSDSQARLLITHVPAALEEFFEEFGVPVDRAGERPDDLEAPDLAAMASALERNGVQVVAEQRTLP